MAHQHICPIELGCIRFLTYRTLEANLAAVKGLYEEKYYESVDTDLVHDASGTPFLKTSGAAPLAIEIEHSSIVARPDAIRTDMRPYNCIII